MFKRLRRLEIYWVRFMPDVNAIEEMAELEEGQPTSVLVPQNFFEGLNLQVCLLPIIDNCRCPFKIGTHAGVIQLPAKA